MSICPLSEFEALPCPVCNEANLHLGPVSVEQAADTIVVGYSRLLKGPKLSHDFSPRVSERGSHIRISLVGECGHCVMLHYWFRKGCTYGQWEPLAGDSDALFATSLWRD
jgi:hypothetical protein